MRSALAANASTPRSFVPSSTTTTWSSAVRASAIEAPVPDPRPFMASISSDQSGSAAIIAGVPPSSRESPSMNACGTPSIDDGSGSASQRQTDDPRTV